MLKRLTMLLVLAMVMALMWAATAEAQRDNGNPRFFFSPSCKSPQFDSACKAQPARPPGNPYLDISTGTTNRSTHGNPEGPGDTGQPPTIPFKGDRP